MKRRAPSLNSMAVGWMPGHKLSGFRPRWSRNIGPCYQPTFTFFGRDPKYDRTLPRDGPVIVTGSSAPDIIDPVTGRARRARSDDIARIAHLIHKLPAYDVFSISTLADDAPPGQFTLARLYPSLKHCSQAGSQHNQGHGGHPDDPAHAVYHRWE